MRLTEAQVKCIISVAAVELKTRPFEVFLYGSRVDDSLKGGDIDLYFLSENDWSVEDQKSIFRLMAALKAPRLWVSGGSMSASFLKRRKRPIPFGFR